jgi:hypothetical protein
MTPPYFHDGSVATLSEAVRVMARVQLGRRLTDAEVMASRRSAAASAGGALYHPRRFVCHDLVGVAMRIFFPPPRGSIRILTAYLMVVGLCAPMSSWAYRPFVSTDATVADPKEVELELGYFMLEREKHRNSFIIPRTVINYGLVTDLEAVGDFAIRRTPDGEVNLIDAALFLKGVLKEGVLQDKDGVGFAIEAGPLLPSTEKGERKFGFEGIGILTAKVGPFTGHLNGGLGIERSTGDLAGIWGLVGELPVATGLRLVGEVNGDKPRREDQRDSALLGLIWQPWSSRNLWFDAGVRRALTGGVPDWQFTFGLTVGFSVSGLTRSWGPSAEWQAIHASSWTR